jgi:CheY-like chemotaxis protein
MKYVLDVGNCAFDHQTLQSVLSEHWEVELKRTTTLSEAIRELDSTPYDLVIVNRILEGDGLSGLELVKHVVQNHQPQGIPIVFLTNYPEVQEEAIQAGASASFGKRDLRSNEVRLALAQFLR